MWPSSTSLTTIGSENFISTDASTFLQVGHDKFLQVHQYQCTYEAFYSILVYLPRSNTTAKRFSHVPKCLRIDYYCPEPKIKSTGSAS